MIYYLVFLLLGVLLGVIFSLFFKKDSYLGLFNNEKETSDKLRQDILYKEKENATLKEKNLNLENQLENQNKKFILEFENLANKILEEKSKKFVEINEDRVGNILNPLKEKIQDFEKQIKDSYDKESKDRISLELQVKALINLNQQLSGDAQNLTKALKGDNKMQGNWGESQLEKILESSGLQKDIHYFLQKEFKGENGEKLIPDVVISLPENKSLIIDSKVSLVAYSNYFNEENENFKKDHLKKHIESIKEHIKNLSSKKYQSIQDLNSADYVVMFIPIEASLWLALKEYPTFIEDALKFNILLVSTTNLIATLRIVDMMWKQDKQSKNVVEIAKEGGALYDKFVGFLDDMEKVGKNIDTVKNSYSDALTKLDGRGGITSRVENLKKLGAKVSKQIDQKYINNIEN